ncbi:hypothetical protein HMPREF9094_1887 [Fusobacterium animalis ATCC 51191]|uniref:Uncharacterized protein n=1 Tax=Fusobacterium animalis ATCC 51191 TaxID=997347 RepID=F9EPN2_9FUSO|nr:hypothetical protein HMPREF9094_1887 [Fusobacterium animalis ATCC 51191]
MASPLNPPTILLLLPSSFFQFLAQSASLPLLKSHKSLFETSL